MSGGASPPTGDPANKVARVLQERASRGEDSEFIVVLEEQVAPGRRSVARPFDARRTERLTRSVERLRAVALNSQQALLDDLAGRGIEHRSYWVANVVWVRGPASLATELARHGAVDRVIPNDEFDVELPEPDGFEPDASAIESSLAWVGAPDVWGLSYTGQGVVMGGADTGYDWDHPALKSQYRGWNGSTANHDYAWHDAVHSSAGVCGHDSPTPCDDHGHGTHTMGTMVGDDGGSNQIGMAPGARWIGCRNMDAGSGTPVRYIECFQWFMAPTDIAGQNPDPAMAPHIINNSWSCTPGEGCVDVTLMQTVVESVRAAGIVVVASAGNNGPGCSTVENPTSIYDASFTVGATNLADVIAGFSGRGPVTSDGSLRLKPDISAPGVGIRSSAPGGSYGLRSGTSMAAPHVAGLLALLISSNPALAGDVGALENIVRWSAVPLTTSQGCGGDGPTDVPNHTYGHGRIDALAAVLSALPAVPSLAPVSLWIAALLLAALGLIRLQR